MIKETISYENFDGEKRTEDFYFHISKVDITRLNLKSKTGTFKGDLEELLKDKEHNGEEMLDYIMLFIETAYGKRSADGTFYKDKDAARAFINSDAAAELVVDLMNSADKLRAFIRGVMPKNASDSVH